MGSLARSRSELVTASADAPNHFACIVFDDQASLLVYSHVSLHVTCHRSDARRTAALLRELADIFDTHGFSG